MGDCSAKVFHLKFWMLCPRLVCITSKDIDVPLCQGNAENGKGEGAGNCIGLNQELFTESITTGLA